MNLWIKSARKGQITLLVWKFTGFELLAATACLEAVLQVEDLQQTVSATNNRTQSTKETMQSFKIKLWPSLTTLYNRSLLKGIKLVLDFKIRQQYLKGYQF